MKQRSCWTASYFRKARAGMMESFGFDLAADAPVKPAEIVLVTPDGNARIVAEDVYFPNGTVITPDGRTLILAETWGNCLTAFDIQSDGTLKNRRTWANLSVRQDLQIRMKFGLNPMEKLKSLK